MSVSSEMPKKGGRRAIPIHQLSRHEMSKTQTARRKANSGVVLQVMKACPWFVQHCKQNLVDMGVINYHGELLVDLEKIAFSPPEMMRGVKEAKAPSEDDDEDALGVVTASPLREGVLHTAPQLHHLAFSFSGLEAPPLRRDRAGVLGHARVQEANGHGKRGEGTTAWDDERAVRVHHRPGPG